MTADLDTLVAARLEACGHRFSSARRELVDVLRRAGQPVRITDVLEGRPHLAQSSVYRNLAVLETAGVVRRIVTDDDYAHYELDEALTEHHHHLICSGCGTVTDTTLPSDVERRLDDALHEIAADAGFVIDHHRLDLIGRCRVCAAG
jgi:Fe2+ or Zn2+ uptake regulation protein